jgi:hypothetical protein
VRDAWPCTVRCVVRRVIEVVRYDCPSAPERLLKCPAPPEKCPPPPPPPARASADSGISAAQPNAAAITASRILRVTGLVSLHAHLSCRAAFAFNRIRSNRNGLSHCAQIIANAAQSFPSILVQCTRNCDAAVRNNGACTIFIRSRSWGRHKARVRVASRGRRREGMGQRRLDHDAPRGCPRPVDTQALLRHAGLSAMR